MKKMFLFTMCCLFIAATSSADIYEWVDEKGNIHVVDDILSVPLEYREKVKAYKQKTHMPESKPSVEKKVEQPAVPADKEELFGDYPLEWWKREFEKRKKEISDAENIISDQKKYIGIFERGRQWGQTPAVYTNEEVDTYNEYKKQLPANEQRLEELKKELEEFKRKATIYGVPRAIRE